MAVLHVTLVLATVPGLPPGGPELRYDIELALDATGRPDATAWVADPEPWRARRMTPDQPPLQGDVQHDPDHGWSIRFFAAAAEGPDAPETALDFGTEPVRPGEYVRVTEPDGTAFTYRVVAVG